MKTLNDIIALLQDIEGKNDEHNKMIQEAIDNLESYRIGLATALNKTVLETMQELQSLSQHLTTIILNKN